MGVSRTGRYILRYRVYDHRTSQSFGVAYGSPFEVFNESGFPGMEAATPMTQSLAPLYIPGVQTSARRSRFP